MTATMPLLKASSSIAFSTASTRALPWTPDALTSCQPMKLRAFRPMFCSVIASRPGGDLLAAGDDHVIFLLVVERGGLAAQLHQPVGLAGHGRDDDEHLVAGFGFAMDARRDAADALDPRHRRAAEFHHDTHHCWRV